MPDEKDLGPRGRSLDDFHIRLMRAFQAQRAFLRPRAQALGIGQGQPKLLVYVAAHGPVTQREVAEFFDMDPGAVSRMLDALEREGLVASAPGRDRRCKALTATPAGLATADAWEVACDAEQEAMLEGLSPEERERLADLLARVTANLRRAVSEGGEA